MASILTTINRLFKKLNPPEKSTRVEVTPLDNGSDAYIDNFSQNQLRLGVLNAMLEMYKGDPRCKESLSTLGRDSVIGGFEISAKQRLVQTVAKDLFGRLSVMGTLDDAVRLSSRDGDSFYEIVVDDNYNIIDLSRKPTRLMHRNSNASDVFENPQKAYSLKRSPYDENSIDFPEWQILHLRWNHDGENRYGTAQFAPAITAYNRMREGEIDLATRRKSNAGQKLLHYVDGDEADIERYKEINSDALLKPFRAITNFFTNKESSIKVLHGDQNIGNIKDVQHQIDTWSTSSPVPLFLLGYGADLNRDILTDQREQYQKTLFSITEWMNKEILRPLLDLQLLLLGYWPEDFEYAIEWLRYANTRQEKFDEATAMMETVSTAAEGITAMTQIRSAETGYPILADEFIVEVVKESLGTILGDEIMTKFKLFEPSEDTIMVPEEDEENTEEPAPQNGTVEAIEIFNQIGRL